MCVLVAYLYIITPDTCVLMFVPVQSEMEMESLVMARKQLLQQWSSSLLGMGRRDEALSAMQEAVR